MSSNTDDVDDEYLDDPITLMAIDVKKEIFVEDQIIDIETSSDEEETYTSSYGKKNFVLPVTFFDNTRNVRLLNKCKPMSISIVDCKQYPTSYTKENESNGKSDDSSLEIDYIYESDTENKPNSADAQNVAIKTSITAHKADENKSNGKSDDTSVKIDDKYVSDTENKPNSTDAQNFAINTNITAHKADENKSNGKSDDRSVKIDDKYESDTENKPNSAIAQNVAFNISITAHKADENKSNGKPDDSSVKIDNKYETDTENNTNAQNVVINTSIVVHETDKKKEGEKKRRGPKSDSFYEKLKRRKENSKQIALNCKDLSQVDFKRNTGLVGLKITDNIFKLIVNTEKALVRTKKPAENKSKESNENGLENPSKKNGAPKEKCKKTFNVVEKTLSVVKSAETKSKENKQSDTEKERVITKSIESTKDKFKGKSDSVVKRALTKTDLTHVENQFKTNLGKDAENTLIRTSITSAKDDSKEKSETNMYMKKVGAALDNLGTSIIPVTDSNLNNGASNNITVTDNIENKSIKTYKNSAFIMGKLRNSNDIEMRCSLKIPSKKIVEKVLKLKEVKSIGKHGSDVLNNTIVQQSPKETITSSSCVVSEKDKVQCKSMDVAYSRDRKQVEKPVAKYASRTDQPGSNSPVIPCTTITVRPGPPKLTQNIPLPKNTTQNLKKDNATAHDTSPISLKHFLPAINIVEPKNTSNDAQKPTKFHNIATVNQEDLSNNSQCTDSSKQPTVVTQTKVKAVSNSNDTSVCIQHSMSNLKTLKITEYKPPNNYPFAARLIDIKNNISAPNLPVQNISKTNLTKENNQVNRPIKSATFSGNTVHINNQTMHGLIKNQTCSNPQMSPSRKPKFSGHNAIILRRPPPPPSRDFQYNTPSNQGQPIQTVINYRPQYQSTPYNSTPMRFRLPPPYPPPPPNYPPPPSNYASPPNFTQMRPNQTFISPNGTTYSHFRGIGMGLNNLRFSGPRPGGRGPENRLPRGRPLLQVSPRQDNIQINQGPRSPQVNKDSFIGNTANGDQINKINIPPSALVTDTVNDKQMMLSELNNAMMSPELIANKPEDKPTNDIKRKADPKAVEPVKQKYSKPCPLSKKINVATDLNKEKILDKASPNSGYSPPILPIMTYEESFRIFKNDTNTKKSVSTNDTQNRIPSRVKCTARIMKLYNKKQKRTHTDSGKQDKAKKITFEDYRKRAKDGADRIDVDKIRKHNESKNVTDDFNQDLGYDSDSTVKL